MTIFKLKNFPNVCRLCLQPKSSAEIISLDSYRPAFGSSISEMLEEVSLKVPFELACYLPVEACESCLDVFELFYKYKRKLDLIQRFSCCLADVKCGNQRPLVELFDGEKQQLQVLFKDLDLCDREDAGVEEMLKEFNEYDLASTICIKVETVDDEEVCGEVMALSEDGVEEKLDVPSFLSEFQKALEERHDESEVHGEVVSEAEVPDAGAGQSTTGLDEDLKSEYTMIEDDEEYEIDMEDDVDYSADEKPPPQKRRYVRLPEEEVDEQQCGLKCTFKTTFPSQFEKHLARVHGDEVEILSCHRVSCAGDLFDSLELLRQHKNDAHSTHICMVCGKVTKHLIALENHTRSHERERDPTVRCSMCDEMFRSEVEMQRHVTKAHMSRLLFECHECGLGFKHKLLLTQHLLTHSVERNYTCNQCEMAFKTSNHLRRHIRTVHTEIRYTCEHCPMTYGRRDKLRMHMERAHDIQTYFVCEICCTSFESDGKLQEHNLRHENAQDLECGICLTSCATPEDFNEHMCITYQEDYVCCNRDFRYHSFYNRHMFLAHGLNTNARVKPKAGVLMGKQRALRKPVERCPKCEYVFATRKLKKQHMETCEGQVVIFEIEPVADEAG
ncbi:zinc finger protein 700-like [Ochlerotatus camptorhynchus]|uniref:zinc finger protein 700-like n=1 Tax=Ochlerotatus camptorhynchus TaxID=644619 RepID=UPI0031D92CCF